MSPFEYFKLIKEINKEEFSGIVEIFAMERMIGEQDCAEFDFQGKFNGLDMTMRWLVFLRNNYACQLRIGVPTVLYQGRKVEIENLLDSVSFPVNKKLLPLKKDPRIREYRKALESTKKVGDPYLIAWFVVNNFTTKFLFNP